MKMGLRVNVEGLRFRANGLRQLELPPMIDDPRLSFKIMRGQLTIGQFQQVMRGYEITGHNAYDLRLMLNVSGRSQAGDALTYLSLLDQRAYAKEVRAQTGRQLRGMTNDEWNAVPDDIRAQMTGTNWFWTETEITPGEGHFILRSLHDRGQFYTDPGTRGFYSAVRLVENKKAA